MMKICVYPNCKKELTGQKKRFCSDDHREKSKSAKRSLLVVPLPTMNCIICDAEFQPKHKASVYCYQRLCKETGRLRRLEAYNIKLSEEKRLNRERMTKKRQLTNFGSTTRYVKPADQMMSDRYVPHTTIVNVTTTDLSQSSEREAIQAFLDAGGKIKKVGYIQDTCISKWEEQTEFETSDAEDFAIKAAFREPFLE